MHRLFHHMALVLLGLLLLTTAAAASAGSLKVKRLLENGMVVAEVKVPKLVDSDLRERIRSGLTNRLVIEAKLVPEGMNAPALFTVTQTIEIVFDLWEEHYLITYSQGGPVQVVKVKKLDAVAKVLRRPMKIELGSAAACDHNKRYRLDVTLTINPVSQRVLQKSREMISPSPSDSGGSRSLLGSVARIFFNVTADPGVRSLRGLTSYTYVVLSQNVVVPKSVEPKGVEPQSADKSVESTEAPRDAVRPTGEN